MGEKKTLPAEPDQKVGARGNFYWRAPMT